MSLIARGRGSAVEPRGEEAAVLPSIQSLILSLPAILLAITFHEFAHGWMADRFGDPTARLSGRLTLDPLAHIDPIGFLMLIFLRWGWAKPVPVNPYNFRRPKQGMLYTALAGPVANILLAFVTAIVIIFLQVIGRGNSFVNQLLGQIFDYNLILAAFNLIPIPPLDGSKILAGLLPDQGANFVYSIEPYGPWILIILVATGLTGVILNPLVGGLQTVISVAVGGLFHLFGAI